MTLTSYETQVLHLLATSAEPVGTFEVADRLQSRPAPDINAPDEALSGRASAEQSSPRSGGPIDSRPARCSPALRDWQGGCKSARRDPLPFGFTGGIAISSGIR